LKFTNDEHKKEEFLEEMTAALDEEEQVYRELRIQSQIKK